MIGDKLVGFSLDQAILNPDVAQKTEAETKELLLRSGVWTDIGEINKVALADRLADPLRSELG